MQAENKPSLTEVLIQDYDISKGDKVISKEINGSWTYSIHIIGKDMTDTLDSTVSLFGTNDDKLDEKYWYDLSKSVTLNSADCGKVMDGYYLSPKYIILKIKQNTCTGGLVTIISTLSRAL